MSAFGVFDEIFNPAAHEAAREGEEARDHVRPAPTPSDDDGYRISLDEGLVVVPLLPVAAVLPERVRVPRPDDEDSEGEDPEDEDREDGT